LLVPDLSQARFGFTQGLRFFEKNTENAFYPAKMGELKKDQLQLVPSGGDSGPRWTSTELKFSVIYIRVQCDQPVG
jgi:hypothetical protein